MLKFIKPRNRKRELITTRLFQLLKQLKFLSPLLILMMLPSILNVFNFWGVIILFSSCGYCYWLYIYRSDKQKETFYKENEYLSGKIDELFKNEIEFEKELLFKYIKYFYFKDYYLNPFRCMLLLRIMQKLSEFGTKDQKKIYSDLKEYFSIKFIKYKKNPQYNLIFIKIRERELNELNRAISNFEKGISI